MGRNDHGDAAQFTVSKKTFLQRALIDIPNYWDMYPDYFDPSLTGVFEWVIYDKTDQDPIFMYAGTIPDTRSEIYRKAEVLDYSPNLTEENLTEEDRYINYTFENHVSSPMNMWLTPGVYWIAIEDPRINNQDGLNGGIYTLFGNLRFRRHETPEPATMLLFGIGLVGLGGSKLRKKKK